MEMDNVLLERQTGNCVRGDGQGDYELIISITIKALRMYGYRWGYIELRLAPFF